jgi:error-prone DNA polymerase
MYVELHGRSAFSFLQGACLPEEYAEAAAKLELSAMARISVYPLQGNAGVFGPRSRSCAAWQISIQIDVSLTANRPGNI